MAQLTRLQVVALMEETGLVPLFYHPDPALGKKVLQACYLGGARLLEFTARGEFAHEVFAELRKYARVELPEMAVGVGSVTDAAAASHYMAMGADFVVTPAFREDIARGCNRRKVLWVPGCGTPTEIAQAEELGCEIVKLFPGSVYGPEFVKSIKGPQPWTKIMPTGGVTTDKENLKAWFQAGVSCVGMGSNLISKEILLQQDFKGLEADVRSALATIKSVQP
ncbi:MAG: bifunctional 4-hydroxy-2-oxoglutarate aldolase/2-dehydro-3-deoxy-phosphogluconate aldolase [Allomuricauda sp.]